MGNKLNYKKEFNTEIDNLLIGFVAVWFDGITFNSDQTTHIHLSLSLYWQFPFMNKGQIHCDF